MSASRIQDGCDSSYRAGQIQPGDLVTVNNYFIDETYYEQLKDFTGLVTRCVTEDEMPALMEVFWSDGSLEKMYEDELDRIGD